MGHNITRAYGNEERDRRLEVVKLLTALSYCVGGSFICSVFQHQSQHQINAYNTTNNDIPLLSHARQLKNLVLQYVGVCTEGVNIILRINMRSIHYQY